MRKFFKIFLSTLFLATSVSALAQSLELIPLNLPVESNNLEQRNYTNARLKLIDTSLYVPTIDGIYSIDMTNTDKGWSQEGFKGEQILEFVKKENEIIAITRNFGSNLMLYSSDNGKTFEDISPLEFSWNPEHCSLTRLVQDPADENILYTTAVSIGILKSEDFGKTWHRINEMAFGNGTYTGFEINPLDHNILTQHGENMIFAPVLQISYDGGQTWKTNLGYPNPEIKLSDEFNGDNCIHDIAFHPTDVNTWIFGGEGIICKSNNAGMNWDMKKNGWVIEDPLGYLYSIFYDNKDPNILYSLGTVCSEKNYEFHVSLDGGESWHNALSLAVGRDWEYIYQNMIQDDNSLIILAYDEVYLISKQTLLDNLEKDALKNITLDLPSKPNDNSNIYNAQGIKLQKEPEHVFFIKDGAKYFKR